MIRALAAALLLLAAPPVAAQLATREVVVLTSFPKELFETYKQADGRRGSDKDVNAAFKEKPDVKSGMETEWDTAAKSSYARARELAEGAAAKIR